jgi:hypothetical protein
VPTKKLKITQEEFDKGIKMLKSTVDMWVMLADPSETEQFMKMREFVDILESSCRPAAGYDVSTGNPTKRKKIRRSVFDAGIIMISDILDARILLGDLAMNKRYEKLRSFMDDVKSACRPPADYNG